MPTYAETIVTLPVEGRFHYLVPDHLEPTLSVGHRVAVPFGRRRVTGFVTALSPNPPDGFTGKFKKISDVLDDEPLLTADLLAIVAFASDYYLSPLGEVLKVALPPGLTAASVATLKATAAGRRALEDGTPLSARVQEALEKAARPAGVKKSVPTKKTVETLIEKGWAGVRETFGAKDSEETIEVVARSDVPETEAMAKLERAPARKRVYAQIGAEPRTVDGLAQALGRDVVRRALKGLMADELVVRSRQKKSEHTEPTPEAALEVPLDLSDDQRTALGHLLDALKAEKHRAFLLRGVTGSGKTEVYLQTIAEARAKGQGAIVLVPEIALTSQLEARFRARFGNDVAVLHSQMTDKERRRNWHQLRSGERHIALGPRSAVWAPVQNLGVIVVDEEHDASFKQHNDLRYSGRDLALYRAHKAHAVCILGTATPALETQQLAREGRLTELTLAKRISGRPLPEVSIVDLGRQREERGEFPLLSRPLEDALRNVVQADEQAILFLNRRGFNTVVVCDDCGEMRKCPDCSVSLTHHKGAGRLVCHYCGHNEAFARPCADCQSEAMKPYGAGTERVADLVAETIPGARVLRLDRDITQKVGALEDTLDRFRRGEANVLVGTQMVAKGHDFPKVTLVGILSADSSLAFPDFRAAERTFQLITQVAGRAGRAELPGRVFVQTFQPEHYALICALDHDDQRFFELEAASRKSADYPPFSRVGLVRIEAEDRGHAENWSRKIGQMARATGLEELRVRGPVTAPLERVRGRWRFMVMISARTPARLVQALRQVKRQLDKVPSNVDLIFDVDALDML